MVWADKRLRTGWAAWAVLPAAAVLLLAACSGGGGSSTSVPEREDSPVAAIPAPEFPGGHTWFNVQQPLTIAGLRGKVVLLDFWTLGCINCQHIVPDLKRLEAEFGDTLVVIGVHSGKYDREHDDQTVRQAVLQFGLEHPVVNDPNFEIWSAYGANAWPTVVLIDPEGNVASGRSGEGVYEAFQPRIASLVEEYSVKGEIDETPIALDLESEGTTSTILSYPSAVLADADGHRLFTADAGHNRIVITDLEGAIQDVIGSGREGFDDGLFEEASLREPQGLALSPDGQTLYIADTRNHAVRIADLASREVATIAGTGRRLDGLPQDSPARTTDLASPWGLVLQGDTLFIAMAGSHQIWTMDLTRNTVSVFAGSGLEGIDDGPRAQATLAQPAGLTTDGTFLYWVDPESSSVRRVPIGGDGEVSTLVGSDLFVFGDADGMGTEALLQHPQGIQYVDATLYVADTYNHKLRTVDPESLLVTTLAGGSEAGLMDGEGAQARLFQPGGLSVADGVLYVADTNNHAIRTLRVGDSTVSTLTLSNLAVASRGLGGGQLKISLDGQTVSPEADSLRIRLTTPQGYHLNSLAPSELALSSSNPPVLEIGKETVAWSTDDPSVEVSVPVSLRAGDAVLAAEGDVYYCRNGGEAVCLIQHLNIVLPVTADDGASARELVIDYDLLGAP